MEKLSERISFLVLVFFLLIFAIEGAIMTDRMPANFRNAVLPRINNVINLYDETEERLDLLEKRVDLLMELEAYRVNRYTVEDSYTFKSADDDWGLSNF